MPRHNLIHIFSFLLLLLLLIVLSFMSSLSVYLLSSLVRSSQPLCIYSAFAVHFPVVSLRPQLHRPRLATTWRPPVVQGKWVFPDKLWNQLLKPQACRIRDQSVTQLSPYLTIYNKTNFKEGKIEVGVRCVTLKRQVGMLKVREKEAKKTDWAAGVGVWRSRWYHQRLSRILK